MRTDSVRVEGSVRVAGCHGREQPERPQPFPQQPHRERVQVLQGRPGPALVHAPPEGLHTCDDAARPQAASKIMRVVAAAPV